MSGFNDLMVVILQRGQRGKTLQTWKIAGIRDLGCTLRNSTFIFCGIQAAEGILYVQVPSEISLPVSLS